MKKNKLQSENRMHENNSRNRKREKQTTTSNNKKRNKKKKVVQLIAKTKTYVFSIRKKKAPLNFFFTYLRKN